MDAFKKILATRWVGECKGVCLEFWLVGFSFFLVLFLGGMVEFHKDLVVGGMSKERDNQGTRSTVHPTSPSDLYHPAQADMMKHLRLGDLQTREIYSSQSRVWKSKIRLRL